MLHSASAISGCQVTIEKPNMDATLSDDPFSIVKFIENTFRKTFELTEVRELKSNQLNTRNWFYLFLDSLQHGCLENSLFYFKKIFRKLKNDIFDSFIFWKITNQKHRKNNFNPSKFQNISILQKITIPKISIVDSDQRSNHTNRRRWFFRCERQALHSKTICGLPGQKKMNTPTETEHIKETKPKGKKEKWNGTHHQFAQIQTYARVRTGRYNFLIRASRR